MGVFSDRVVIAGCARNCAGFLPAVLSNIEAVAGLFSQAAFVFFENDSTDQTHEILSDWGRDRPNFHILSVDGLASSEPVRTKRLEVARNTIIEFVRIRELAAFDHLVLFDLDDVNSAPLDLGAVKRSVDFLSQTPDAAAVFANQLGTYYDMWALRHPELCPGDVWEDVFDWVVRHGASDEEAYAATFGRRVLSLPVGGQPLEVDSAFGGLGIYKMSFIARNPNPYLGYRMKLIDQNGATNLLRWQVCEHVHFHRGLRSLGGRLFVLPWLINAHTGAMNFPPSAWRSMIF